MYLYSLHLHRHSSKTVSHELSLHHLELLLPVVLHQSGIVALDTNALLLATKDHMRCFRVNHVLVIAMRTELVGFVVLRQVFAERLAALLARKLHLCCLAVLGVCYRSGWSSWWHSGQSNHFLQHDDRIET